MFTNTVILPVQCGGRNMSSRTRNHCCYYFLFWTCLCVRFTLMLIGSIENVILSPVFGLSLWFSCFGLSFGKVLLFTTLCILATTLKLLFPTASLKSLYGSFIRRNTCPVYHFTLVVSEACPIFINIYPALFVSCFTDNSILFIFSRSDTCPVYTFYSVIYMKCIQNWLETFYLRCLWVSCTFTSITFSLFIYSCRYKTRARVRVVTSEPGACILMQLFLHSYVAVVLLVIRSHHQVYSIQ